MRNSSPAVGRTVALLVIAMSSLSSATGAAAGATSEVAPADMTPPVRVVTPGCNFDEDRADAWTSPKGVEHVVYQVDGNESFTCEEGAQWHAWRSPGGTWKSERTPYVGTLLSVTGENKTFYIMYADPAGIHLAKRTGAGDYRDVELLSSIGLGHQILPSGDLVVRDKKWWAVWSENRTPGQLTATDLWQAKTLGSKLDRTRVTDTATEDDDQPALALRKDGSVFVLWTMNPTSDAPSSTRSGTSSDGVWTISPWDNGLLGSAGDVSVSKNDVLSIVWARNTNLMYADDRTGSFVSEIVAGRSGKASVDVSGGTIYVSTTAVPFRTQLLSRDADGGTWSGELLTPDTDSRSLDVTAYHGEATVYYTDFTKLLSRTTR